MENENLSLEKEIIDNGVVCFTPKGNSMRPFIIGEKHTVLVSKKEGKLKTFDVALYKNPDGKYILHRIVEVLEDGYTFTGDFTTNKEFVSEECVLGYAIGYFTDKKRKKFIDASSPIRLKKVAKYYKNENKRLRYIKCKSRFLSFSDKIKGVFIKKEKGNV
jgi:hypothetical protein